MNSYDDWCERMRAVQPRYPGPVPLKWSDFGPRYVAPGSGRTVVRSSPPVRMAAVIPMGKPSVRATSDGKCSASEYRRLSGR